MWTTVANPKWVSMAMGPSVGFCLRELSFLIPKYEKCGSNDYRCPRCAHKQLREQWVALEALGSRLVCRAMGTSSEPSVTWCRCSPRHHVRPCATILSLREGDNFLICFPKSCIWLSFTHSFSANRSLRMIPEGRPAWSSPASTRSPLGSVNQQGGACCEK